MQHEHASASVFRNMEYTCGHEMTLGYGNKAAMLVDKQKQESGKCLNCKNADLMEKMKAKKECVK